MTRSPNPRRRLAVTFRQRGRAPNESFVVYDERERPWWMGCDGYQLLAVPDLAATHRRHVKVVARDKVLPNLKDRTAGDLLGMVQRAQDTLAEHGVPCDFRGALTDFPFQLEDLRVSDTGGLSLPPSLRVELADSSVAHFQLAGLRWLPQLVAPHAPLLVTVFPSTTIVPPSPEERSDSANSLLIVLGGTRHPIVGLSVQTRLNSEDRECEPRTHRLVLDLRTPEPLATAVYVPPQRHP